MSIPTSFRTRSLMSANVSWLSTRTMIELPTLKNIGMLICRLHISAIIWYCAGMYSTL